MGMIIPETNKQKYFLTEGVCSGKITLIQQGNAGFGYDPILYLMVMIEHSLSLVKM